MFVLMFFNVDISVVELHLYRDIFVFLKQLNQHINVYL